MDRHAGMSCMIVGNRPEAVLAEDWSMVPQAEVERLNLNCCAHGGGVEGQQGHCDVGRELARGRGKIKVPVMRPRADRDQQVVDQRKMQHLLGGDRDDLGAPALHDAPFMCQQILVGALLERERGIQVSAHQAVLDFCRFREHADQLAAVGCSLQEVL